MIDFACKQFNLRDIIKCSLTLSKGDMAAFEHLLKHPGSHTAEELAQRLGVDLTTAQRAVKKLHSKGLARRLQRNLEGGGYVFEYRASDRKAIRKIVLDTVRNWTGRVEQELEGW